jgi:hypothetical protein
VADLPDTTDLDVLLAHFQTTGAPSPDELTLVTWHVGRNAAPRLLYALWVYGLLTHATAAPGVTEVWSLAEWPQDALRQEDWRGLFELAGYTDDGVPTERPTEPLRLYRGATRRYRRRWAWTDDVERARWFAARFATYFGEPGRVWTATVEPWRLFARIHEAGRSEGEYVLDTKGLKIVGFTPHDAAAEDVTSS